MFDSTPHPYIITFVNYDGTQLYQSQIGYGLAITYGGTTPVKDTTEQYSYAFKTWSDGFENGVTTVTGDKTYTAQFDSAYRSYTIVFLDGLTNDTLLRVDTVYGATITPPSIPQHEGYKSNGWDREDYTNVHSDLTITATYTQQTGIEQRLLDNQKAKTYKCIENSKIVIIRDSKRFSILGRQLND